MSAHPITTLLLDVGGVLVAPLDPVANRKSRDELAHELGFANGQEMWNHFFESEAWVAAKTGRMVHSQMWETLLTPYGIVAAADRDQFLSRLHTTEGILPEMRALIATVHGRYRLGILSNWDDRLEEILEDQLGIAHYFDVILNSHRIAVAKPDPQAFSLALERLNVRPEEVLFIDDLRRNTTVAEQLGFHTHTYRDFSGLLHDLKQRGILDGADGPEGG